MIAREEDVQPFELSFKRTYSETSLWTSPCDGTTTFQDEVFRFDFDEGKGVVAKDTMESAASGSLQYGPKWIVGKVGSALYFGDQDDRGNAPRVKVNTRIETVQNSFTVSMWVRPDSDATIAVVGQRNVGVDGTSGQRCVSPHVCILRRPVVASPTSSGPSGSPEIDSFFPSGTIPRYARYVLFPRHGASAIPLPNYAGFGVSVAANGVAVFGHTAGWMPCLLSYQADLATGAFTHLVISVDDNMPSLYVNGKMVKEGVRAPKTLFYYPDEIGSGTYGSFRGALDELVVFDRAFSAEEASGLYGIEDRVSASLCVDDEERSGISTLACPEGQEISSIEFASWGTSTGKCGEFVESSECHSPLTEVALEHRCVGKQSCDVDTHAANGFFGDPCSGTVKTLKAQFTCRPIVQKVGCCAPVC